jgi:hypothetical protein
VTAALRAQCTCETDAVCFFHGAVPRCAKCDKAITGKQTLTGITRDGKRYHEKCVP